MALCMRVCMFICVAGGSNCLTPAALHTQNANPSPHPLRDPSLNPRLLSNDFRKSRSDLNNGTNRVSTALNTELKLFSGNSSRSEFSDP